MIRLFKSFSYLVVLMLIAFSMPHPLLANPAPSERPNFSMTILHTNDSHGHVERYPLLATAVQRYEKGNRPTLLLHAGDVFTGTLFFTAYKGKADVDFMNQIGYDAMVIGNHEFDIHSEALANFINDAKFPLLTCNIDFSNDDILRELYTEQMEVAKGGRVYPAIIQTVNGEKIGIIGATTERTPDISNPHPSIQFLSAKKRITEMVDRFESMGMNKIILLSHLGLAMDKQIAKQVDGIDCIIGGHSHHSLKKPIYIKKEEPTIIVQSGEYLEHLGVLNVTFNHRGVITKFDGKLLELNENDLTKDEQMAELLERYEKGIEQLANTKVGKTAVYLQGKRKKVRTGETNLGNLIADIFLWKAKDKEPKTQIAFINAGSIRTSISKGIVTVADIRNVLPFESELVLLQIKGMDLIDILEKSVAHYPKVTGAFLQVSGIRFSFNPKGEPGARIGKVEVKQENGDYSPIDGTKTYWVVTTEYLARGKEGYDILKKFPFEQLSVKDYEALSDFLRQKGTVAPKKEGRITKIK
ncbi:bifunctional metallophosphatase/5'-nucleotidase [Fervidibacillus albus]|uniref:5'-nucleotidase C-terminal domain-containing protein n=1 Tax=Fervidibacillus albus TaxID=2980026 RepID=A0A9E8LUD6_9BACI|nr:5'-nucleotidase C-terminal domain-containing protein [Fervidibacillus albus]WAA09818.1 5'-nucleotidase C-terminal domain-containing protein [Fervidibacillus albus]